MKNHIYTKLSIASTASLTLIIMGCASSGGGSNVLGTVDRGLSSVEQSAQAGRQVIETGTAAASGMANIPGAATGQTGLVDILAQQLGISQHQALGGAGAIFKAAQTSMEPQAFSTLTQSVPGITDMLNAAPVVTSPMGGMGSGVSSLLGGSGSSLSSAASLAASFQQLNLSPDMVGQFIPIVTNYVQNTSGQVSANLLRSALGVP